MATLAPTPAQLRRLEREAGVEFAHGRLVEKRMSIGSCLVVQTVAGMLGNEAAKTGPAHVFGASLGYHCFPDDPNKYRKPDASVVTRARLAAIDYGEAFVPIPPDLAVEVISPNDSATDVSDKVDEYLSAGFPLVWVVEPQTKTVTIRRADGTVTLLFANDETPGKRLCLNSAPKLQIFFPSRRQVSDKSARLRGVCSVEHVFNLVVRGIRDLHSIHVRKRRQLVRRRFAF